MKVYDMSCRTMMVAVLTLKPGMFGLNKKLWDLTVFTNRIDPKLEEDVQWVFINTLSMHDHTLIVTSERGTTYQIDLQTKAITQSQTAWSAAPDVIAHSPDIPEVIDRAITNESLAKRLSSLIA